MRLTINASVTRPADLETWTLDSMENLATDLEDCRTEGEKEDSDLLIPVAEWSSLYRSTTNIVAMSSLFLGDVDGKTDAQIDTLIAALDGVSCILHTTHSHRTPRKEGLGCYRVLIELDREYPPGDHARLWSAINRRLGETLDPGARTPEQGYYLPSYPARFGSLSEVVRLEGKPWSVDKLLSEAALTPGATPTPAAECLAPTLAVLTQQVSAWARGQKDPERKVAAAAAKDLLVGRCPVPVGKGMRNTFMTRLSGYLAHVWPRSPAVDIVAYFETVGWDLFNEDGKYPLASFAAMLERFQRQEIETLEAAEMQRAEAQRETVARVTAGERDTLIEEKEIEGLRDTFGPTWQQYLIGILKRDLYFLRPDGTYDPGPVLRESLFVAARNRLAVFGDYVEYTYEDGKGAEKRKTDKAFLEEYATVVRVAAYDMTLTRGGWDAKNETILFPAAVPRVESVEHHDVQAWLDLLDPYLMDMLATIPALGTMLPALVLTGEGGSGKTMLAKSIGRVYGSDPLDAEVAFTNFNAAAMTKQPIVLMDEKVSEAYRREGTTLIRRWLTQGTRMLDEKWQSRVELRGYPRLVIAANNLDVLNTREEMSTEDRDAFSERLVHVNMDPGKAYLMAHRDRIQTHWLDQNHLAEHIRYLAAHWEVEHKGHRFAVASNHTKLHDGLASRSGFASDVAYWLLSYVADPSRVDQAHLPIAFKGGTLRVNTSAVVKGWNHYLKDHRPPTPSQISRALKSLSIGRRQKIKNGKAWVNVHEINPLLLASSNDQHQTLDRFDEIFSLTNTDE